MFKNRLFSARRKSSPFASAAACAAVCLSSGGAYATSGNVTASNAGAHVFHALHNGIKVFGGLASFNLLSTQSSGFIQATGGGLEFGSPTSSQGIQISQLTNFFGALNLHNPFDVSNVYFPMRFQVGGNPRYGWVHGTANISGNQLDIDFWSYNASGGGIKTLDESITPKKLTLSDGRVKLNWSNANESGVARYEVQAKGENGAWAAVDSNAAGEGSYASTLAAGEYRLVVENSDGGSRSISF